MLMKFDCGSRGALRKGAWLLMLFAGLVLGGVAARAVEPPAGIAPVDPPSGGFAIDGNLGANTPDANVGDWLTLTNFPGSGGAVLNAAGAPINSLATFHFVDP